MRNNQERSNRLIPNGIPKYVRIYDNGGKTVDRYTVVFTGNYNLIGMKKRNGRGRDWMHPYINMDTNPTYPQGVFIRGESQFKCIDRPRHGHLGKKIKFEDLPDDCKKLVLEDYKCLWELT